MSQRIYRVLDRLDHCLLGWLVHRNLLERDGVAGHRLLLLLLTWLDVGLLLPGPDRDGMLLPRWASGSGRVSGGSRGELLIAGNSLTTGTVGWRIHGCRYRANAEFIEYLYSS